MKPHKHAKEIKAWANGAEIEYVDHNNGSVWIETTTPSWSPRMEYRIKPSEPEKPEVPVIEGYELVEIIDSDCLAFQCPDNGHITALNTAPNRRSFAGYVYESSGDYILSALPQLPRINGSISTNIMLALPVASIEVNRPKWVAFRKESK